MNRKSTMKNAIIFGISIFMLNVCEGFKPQKEYVNTPADFGINFKEVKLKTNDGFELNTWVYEPQIVDSTTQTILMMNSDAGNMSYNIEYAANLQIRGFRVVTFDYRGFGKSSAFNYDSLDFYNNKLEIDGKTVIDYINETYKSKPHVMALSLGSLVLFNLADKIDALTNNYIIEGGVFNPSEFIKRVEKYKHKKLKYNGLNVEKLNFKNKHNILIFEGLKDQFSTVDDGLEFSRNNSHTNVIVYNGNHLEGMRTLNEKYFDYIQVALN
jgi:hypothetical protein